MCCGVMTGENDSCYNSKWTILLDSVGQCTCPKSGMLYTLYLLLSRPFSLKGL